jgi:PII-like signaling protein/predicted transcriptional regulator
MSNPNAVQRVRIYLSTTDRWEGGPLYLAVLEELQRLGATGATALQGLAGFGPRRRSRPGPIAGLTGNQPVVIEWVDRAERVTRLLPQIDQLISNALVTLEEVPVYRALLRARGPFSADRSVGEIVRGRPPAVAVDAPLSEALAIFAAESISVLPVVADDGRLVGVLTEQDLVWRAGLRLRVELLAHLTAEERDTVLAPLIGRAVAEVMSAEPRSVGAGTAIAQALVTLIEAGYSHMPLVDSAGLLVGLLGPADVLRAALDQAAAAAEGGVRDAEPPPRVTLIMQTVFPQAALGQSLAVGLAQLLTSPQHPLLIVDAQGKLAGTLEAAGVLGGLAGAERAAFLDALQRSEQLAPARLPGADRPLDALVAAPPTVIAPTATILEAATELLTRERESIPVVDTENGLLGIIGRSGLVRALMQQSE